MKITVSGEWHDNAMEIPIVEAWRLQGHQVEMVPWVVGKNFLWFVSKVQSKLGLRKTSQAKRYNRNLVRALAKQKPDVFFVFKGMNVWGSTIQFAQRLGILCVNFNPDHPFVFSGKGSGNENVRTTLKDYDGHITYSQGIQSMLAAYGLKSAVVPFGYQLPLSWKERKAKLTEEVSGSFIGNADDDRRFWMTKFLSNFQGQPFVFYGHGWDQMQCEFQNVTVKPAVYGMAFWEAMRRHRFQLNAMRVHNLDSHNMRSIESLAAGAIGLHPMTSDHLNWIRHEEDGFLFSNFEEAAEQGLALLKMEGNLVREMRENAEDRAEQLQADYFTRAQTMIEFVQSLR